MTPQLLRAPGFLRQTAARSARFRPHLLATALACTAAIPAAHAIAGGCPDAPTITTTTTIGAGDSSYDNMNVVVQGATLTVVGHHTFCSLTVQSGGIVNHVAGDPGGLDLSLSSCTVDGSSEITVSGRGYAGGAGPGSPGNGSPSCGGAAYGGDGGDGSGSPGSRAVYGSIAQPTSLGSGGGWSGSSTDAGPGGGAVHLTVSGTLTVDGVVSADGATSPGVDGGGGSGGSLWLEVGALEGNGWIRANGGAGYGGGGSGGRIAVYYTTHAFTGQFQAVGGGGSPQYGGAGTVLTKAGAGRAEIKVTNGGTGPSAARTTLPNDPIILNADIVIQNSQLTPLGVQTFYSLSMVSGGILTCATGDTNRVAIIVSTDCTVDGASSITVSGRGYAGGAGPGSPGSGSPSCGGAAYGGNGGDGSGLPGSRAVYGSIAQPTSLGSGGGWSSSSTDAGAGGGAVHLSVSGTLYVDGMVSADGAASPGVDGGGGSGGSLWLEVGALEGYGVIRANGGAGYGGGGSGGRIAVYYTTHAFTGQFQAVGGGGSPQYGGAGTVLTKAGAGRAEIKVTNGGTGPSAARTTLPNDPIILNADIVIQNSQLTPLGVQTFYSLSMVSGGILTCATGDTNRVAIIVSTDCTVDGASSITVSGRGYAGGAGPGSPGSGSPSCGGAAYGGNGGDGSGLPGSRAVYGSIAQPTSLGSGGGWSSSSTDAGAGGGAVHLSVSGTLYVYGMVSADGAASPGVDGGGGSGGSLWLEVGALEGYGVIRANGGAGYGGGGSGGRIAVYYTTHAFTGQFQAVGGGGSPQYGGAGTVLTKAGAGRAEIKVTNGGTGPSAARTTLPNDPIILNADIVIQNSQLTPLGVQTFYSLSMVSGGILTCATGDTNRVAIIVSTDCTVDGASSITVSGRGYAGGAGPGSPGSGSPSCGGAAYGGNGGDGSGLPGSRAVYGSIAQPTSLGSGGGWSSSSTDAGAGGGAVHLSVSGTLYVYGMVSADGAASPGVDGGGGSGGSLWLEVGALEGYGVIRANGGAGYGGGGSGGRIAVYSADCFQNFNTATLQVNGGAGAGPGGNGTILLGYANSTFAGIEDRFLPPTEPASPSADLVAGLSGITLVPFDGIPIAGAFAHTFTGIPAQTQAAKVVFHARAGAGANIAADRVTLGYSNAGGFHPIWRRYFGSTSGTSDPGLTGRPWVTDKDTTFVIDLANLPRPYNPPLDATSMISARGHLDLVVDGNTGVDYALLTYGNCNNTVAVGDLPPVGLLPTVVALQAAPNPFAQQTRVSFELPRESDVRLAAFDVLGRRVRTLYEGSASAGVHHLDWSASSSSGGRLQAGVYFIRLEVGERTLVRRVALTR